MKRERGCETASSIPDKWKIGNITFGRCPLKIIDEPTKNYIKAYQFLQHGILPHVGGWLDQSHNFIEAMTLIETELSRGE